MKSTEVIKMLLDIDLAVDKRLAIKKKICEILDEMEKQPDALVLTQDSIKIGKPTPPDEVVKVEEKPPEDDPVQLLRSKEVIGKTNRGGAKSTFDTGKLMALRSAGWSIKAIADEMGCTEQTIRNHMKKEGIK